MTLPASLSDLEAFARECIRADHYPHDSHVFRVFRCDVCDTTVLEITIEHHTGSKKGDFKGVIWGKCTACGYRGRLFSFTGEHRKWFCEEKPVCTCRNESFIVGECERIEGAGGLTGFFDEGVVVGKCAHCGRNRALVYTD